jgi:hypothetical protein
MKRFAILVISFLNLTALALATDLSTAPSQDLLAVYKQLRTIQAGSDSAITENVVFKRDSATITFITGRITFAAPIAGRVLAAHFKGEATFELAPPSVKDVRQLGRFTGSPKLSDTFREAVFFFTDDTYTELNKLLKLQQNQGAADPALFAPALKQYMENLNDWGENQRKGNPTMRNLAARMLADLTDASSKGFFLADFKGKESGDLLFHISWNRDVLFLPEYAKGEEVMLLHINTRFNFEWWSGFHLASEYAQSPNPDHRTLLAHCPSSKIDLQIAKDNAISVTAQMEYIVESPSRVIPFNLNGVLRISAIEDGAGNKLSFIQEDRQLDSDPWLILPEPAKAGQTYKMKIVYSEVSTRDSRIVFQRGSGLYYVTSRESWFPSFGAFDDRTQYEIHATSPKRFKFVASGAPVSAVKEKDNWVTVWKSELPIGVIGFNYGDFVEFTQTAPNLSVTAYSGKEVPDELKEIESLKSVYELQGGNFERETGVITSGFNTASNVKYAAGVSLQAFRLYEYLFGALPFKTISVTEQPVRNYGQSWPSLIFLPYDVFLDATTRNSLGLQDSGEEREFYNIVGVHEMAHQWWGHLVGWKTYHDQWLSEGISEFASYFYLRQFQPKEVKDFWNMRRTWLLSKNREGYRPVDVGSVWMNAQLSGSGSTQLIYHKGAYIMEMLRVLMYNPQQKNPDGLFITMMHDFVKTFAGKNASTEDFRQMTEKHIGRPMDWFFNQWVYGTNIPTYDFSYQVADATGGQNDVAITITQSGVPESFQMHLPIYAVINGEMRFLGLAGVTGNKPVKTNIKLPVRPEKIVLDPNRSILAEIRQ